MTVNYVNKHNEISTRSLLFQWDGSFYKLIWREMVIYMVLSYIMRIVMVFGLSEENRGQVEEFCKFNYNLSRNLPIAFILPFFVRLVINRRFAQYKLIPWIDKLGMYIATFIEGKTEYVRLTKRTLIRYCVLSMALCFKSISLPSYKKFDHYEVFITNGLATENELNILTSTDFKFNNYFTPIIWATELLHRVDRRGAIIGEKCVVMLLTEITDFHSKLQSIFFYDWINLPLVYTQVTTLCVYFYFVTALFGDQIVGQELLEEVFEEFVNRTISLNRTEVVNETRIINMTTIPANLVYILANNAEQVASNNAENSNQIKKKNLQVLIRYMNFVPFIEMLLFSLVMGWLKVAETMINPYGDEDEDFETNAIIERNLKIGYLMIERDNFESPNLTEDITPIFLQPDQTHAEDFNLFAGLNNPVQLGDRAKVSHSLTVSKTLSQLPTKEITKSFSDTNTLSKSGLTEYQLETSRFKKKFKLGEFMIGTLMKHWSSNVSDSDRNDKMSSSTNSESNFVQATDILRRNN